MTILQIKNFWKFFKLTMDKITIYTTPTCGFCRMAKLYLDSKNVKYISRDITEDAAAFNEVQQKSNQSGVPVIDIMGDIIIGFDRNHIDLALRKHKLV